MRREVRLSEREGGRISPSEHVEMEGRILTTSQKLAYRIAREVEKAFGGRAHFSWSDDDGSLLARVKITANQPTLKKSAK